MAGYLGTKAVLLSTTAADVIGNAEIGGSLTVGGNLTSTGIEDNASSTAITIDSSQNVGIGTSSPSGVLDIRNGGTQQVIIGNSGAYAGVEYGELLFKEQSTELARVKWNPSGNTFQLINSIAGPMTFATSGTERMRLDASGNVLVGTTAVEGSNGTSIQTGGYITTNRGTTAVAGHHVFKNPNGTVGIIVTSGSATSYNTSSDYRLKTDAQPMTGASARVQALKPVNFEWIADGTRVDGFLAHEAQEVVPEAVTGTKDAMRDEEYEVTPAVYEDVVIPAVLDEDGNELEAERTEQRLVTEAVMGTRSVPEYQGIDQSKLVPLLTAALQEALTKIDEMETRLAALEAV